MYYNSDEEIDTRTEIARGGAGIDACDDEELQLSRGIEEDDTGKNSIRGRYESK